MPYNTYTILIPLLLSISAFSAPKPSWAEVVLQKGDTSFNARKIKVGDSLESAGILKTGPKSVLKILVNKWKNTIILGPNSEMKLTIKELNNKKEKSRDYHFLKGTCRWISNKKSKTKKGKLHTPIASFGVRGTDYLVTVRPEEKEAEIVVFDGAVQFTSNSDQTDSKLIQENQWGGLGGKFGNKITPIKDLSPNLISILKKTLE